MAGPERLPIFEHTVAAFRSRPAGRHHWHGDPEEVPVLDDHYDSDGDGRPDRAVDPDDLEVPHPLKRPGEPMRYRRDVTRGDWPAIASEIEHVRAHLSSVADADDDPETNADDVRIDVTAHIDGDPDLVSVIGELDAEPNAPYLRPGFDPDADQRWTFTRYSEEGRE